MLRSELGFMLGMVCLLLAIHVQGADYEYGVSGTDASGGYVYGEIEADSGSKDVEGYLYDGDGEAVHFEGEWSGKGEIEGYDQEGNYIELEVD